MKNKYANLLKSLTQSSKSAVLTAVMAIVLIFVYIKERLSS